MKKSIVLITGCSSWWKSKKYRKESCLKLMRLKKKNGAYTKLKKLNQTYIRLTPNFIKNII